jgi:outer membrane murein-binding lipoprotein Lpp
MNQCSSELQMNMQLDLQTLISKVAQLESKLDIHLAAQAASNTCARDSTTSTATCCETSQATIWTPTPLIAMFELMNSRMLKLENQVVSTADPGAVIDDSSNTKLLSHDCLAQLESQFNERMAKMDKLLETVTPHTIKERNECSVMSSEQNSAISLTDQLQTLITVISQDPENSPIDKCELLKCCLDNMAVSTSGSTTTNTTVLSKHDELAEIFGILADSSISAERYIRLELLVDMVAESNGKADEHIDNLLKPTQMN